MLLGEDLSSINSLSFTAIELNAKEHREIDSSY
jgi:hypothetical protein